MSRRHESLWRGTCASLWMSRPPASTLREVLTLSAPLAHPRQRASRTPRADIQATGLQGPVCPQTDSLDLLLSGLRQGRRAAVGKRPLSSWEAGMAAPQAPACSARGRAQAGPQVPPPHLREPTRTPGAGSGRARCGRAAPDLYFPLIRSQSSLSHLNEELRARGPWRPVRRELHVSARLGIEPPSVRSGHQP